jgi:hypothetical protein
MVPFLSGMVPGEGYWRFEGFVETPYACIVGMLCSLIGLR